MKYIYLLMQDHNGEKDGIVGAYSSFSNAQTAISAHQLLEGFEEGELFVVAVPWETYPEWDAEE